MTPVPAVPRAFLALTLVALAACAPMPVEEELPPPAPVEPETPPALEQCDAADYRPLVGSNIAAVTLLNDPMLRAYGQGDIITQEYLPQRTNIVYGADGIILRVYCG